LTVVTAASAALSIAPVCSRPPFEQSSLVAAAEDALAIADDAELVSPALALALALTSPPPLTEADMLDPSVPTLALALVLAPASTLVPSALTVTDAAFDVVALVDWA
jgi:hypothetical protein